MDSSVRLLRWLAGLLALFAASWLGIALAHLTGVVYQLVHGEELLDLSDVATMYATGFLGCLSPIHSEHSQLQVGTLAMACSIVANLLILVAAARMRRLRNHRLACIATSVAIVPCSAPWGWPGALIAVLTMWTLNKPSVKAAFNNPKLQAEVDRPAPEQLFVRSTMPFVLATPLVLAVALALTYGVGYLLMVRTPYANKISWPITAAMATFVTQACFTGATYLLVWRRRGPIEAGRAAVQGPTYLIGLDDPDTHDGSVAPHLILPSIFAAAPGVFFSVMGDPTIAVSSLGYIISAAAAWGLFAWCFLTAGGSSE